MYLQVSLLDFGLARGVKIVSVGSSRVDVFDHWENIDNVLFGKNLNVSIAFQRKFP